VYRYEVTAMFTHLSTK